MERQHAQHVESVADLSLCVRTLCGWYWSAGYTPQRASTQHHLPPLFFFLLSFYILNEASTRAVYWWDQRAQEKNRTLRTILMWTRAYKTKSFQKYMCLCVCGDVSVCLNRTRWLWRHLMFDIALNGTYTQTWSKYSIEKKKWNKERENKNWVNSPCLIRERSIFFFIRLCAGCV